jgi:hypothetical protein
MNTRPCVALVAVLAAALVTGVGCDKESSDAGKPVASDPADPSTPSAPPAPPANAAAPAGSPDNPVASVDIRSAKPAAGTWMLLGAADYGFEARFPVAPKKEDMSVPTPAGTIPASLWMAEDGEEVVGLTVMTVPEAILANFNVEGALDGGRDGMVNNVGGTIVSDKQTDFAGQKNARAVVATVPNPGGPELQLEARLVWISPRMYQVIALVPVGSNSSTPSKYFDSFKLTSG